MKIALSIIIALVLAVLLIAAPANAQWDYATDEESETPLTLRAGAAFFLGDTGSSAEPMVGLDYQFPITFDRTRNSDYLNLSADAIKVKTLHTGDELLVPALLSYRRYGIVGPYRVFFQVGAGAMWASENIPELEIEEDFQFAWNLGLGLNLTRDVMLQARYIAGNHPDNDSMITAELGFRF